MFHRQNRFLRTLVFAVGLGGPGFCSLGCANLAIFEAKESSPLPATMSGLRAEIEQQRGLLMDLVSDTHAAGEQRDDNANQMVAIAQRLTRLTTALATLDPDSKLETNSP